jgi:hypothetical protein
MNWFDRASKITFLILALSTWFVAPRVSAQTESPTPKSADAPQSNETSTDEGWHVGITPYLWFAGVHGTSGALGHDASVHASFSDIFKYFNIGAMGVVEARYNRVLMPLDFMWMKLSDDKAIPVTDVAESVKAKMTETMLTPKIGYRVADGKKVKVDALFGIRYWHLSTSLNLQPTQIAGSFSQSASWVDAVAGGRITTILSRKAFATIVGDAGGGSARSDYQIGGFLGYQISRRWVLLAGYRYLSVDYRPNGKAQFVYDVDMPGLMFGATFNLK